MVVKCLLESSQQFLFCGHEQGTLKAFSSIDILVIEETYSPSDSSGLRYFSTFAVNFSTFKALAIESYH